MSLLALILTCGVARGRVSENTRDAWTPLSAQSLFSLQVF